MQPDLPPRPPDGRYDPPRARNRVLTAALSGTLALGLVAGAYTLHSRHEAGRMDAELTSYDVRSDVLVRITFQVVTRGHDGECKVRARERSGNEAGSQVVQVRSNGKRQQLVTVDLGTRLRPVNGELVGCRRL